MVSWSSSICLNKLSSPAKCLEQILQIWFPIFFHYLSEDEGYNYLYTWNTYSMFQTWMVSYPFVFSDVFLKFDWLLNLHHKLSNGMFFFLFSWAFETCLFSVSNFENLLVQSGHLNCFIPSWTEFVFCSFSLKIGFVLS